MVHAERQFLVDRQGLSCANCILDLSAVEGAPRKSIVVLVLEFLDFDAFNGHNFFEEGFPDSFPRFGSQLAVPEGDMNTRLKSWIESLDTIGCQEEDALEILQKPKEDADQCVAAYVLGLACL